LKTSVSGEYLFVGDQIKRSKKLIVIRGLNKNHNHDLKISSTVRPFGPLLSAGLSRTSTLRWLPKG